MEKVRSSNIELLRIVALWMIVAYHTIAFCIYQHYPNVDDIYHAIWLPLHVGVPVFVLISGYFRIKPSVKGVVRLLSYMFIYTVPVGLVDVYLNGGGIFDMAKKLLFVSNSPFWFMRTYFCLYVLSPIINRMLDNSDKKEWGLAIVLLSIVAIYIGMVHFDDSLNSGKNVVNFALIYVLGASVNKFQIYRKLERWKFLVAYLALNCVEMGVYMLFAGNIVGEAFHYGCFQYCSPVLILNAILLLCWFLNIDFHSKTINWLAKSSLAIYLLHTLILYSLIAPVAQLIYEWNSGFFVVFPLILLLAAVVSLGCMLVDKLLIPYYWLTNKLVKPLGRLLCIISRGGTKLLEKI